MTLFKALKILLRNKGIKENLAYSFHSTLADKHEVRRWFEDMSDKWYNHSLCAIDSDERHRSEQKSDALSFMAKYYANGGTININLNNYN